LQRVPIPPKHLSGVPISQEKSHPVIVTVKVPVQVAVSVIGFPFASAYVQEADPNKDPLIEMFPNNFLDYFQSLRKWL